MHLQDLSVDVLTPILDGLSGRDLLACRQVSRYLLEVIDGSERLQYKIDLAVAGMVDGPPSALCTAERRSMLREYQKAWCSLELPMRPTLTIPKPYKPLPHPFTILGNVLLEHTSTGLRLMQLPSRIRGTHWKCWTIDCAASAPGFTTITFALDPAQDLLVLLEYKDQRAQIRLLCVFDGTAHPAAVSTFLCQNQPFDSFACHSELRIHGDAVGCLFFQNVTLTVQPRSSLQVWNWKTGDLVWDLPVHQQALLSQRPQAFSFLDDRHIVALYVHRLAVYGFDPRVTTTTKATSEDFVVSLDIPMRADSEVIWIGMFHGASSSAGLHGRPDTPFESSPSDSLFAIEIDFSSAVVHDDSWFLFVPAPTIRACAARARSDAKARTLEWQAWGKQGARIMRGADNADSWYKVDVQGTRAMAAIWPTDDLGTAHIRVFEFGPVVRRHIQTCIRHEDADSALAYDETEEGKATYVTTPYGVDGAEAFFTEVTTELPFRTSWRNVAQGGFISVEIMMYEDGIVVQRQDQSWQIHSL